MKIAVIGAGIIGVTTAYELARDGHEVTVLERRSAAAEETSFANAGVVAPGYVTPWAAPGMPSKVLQLVLSRHASIKVGLPLSRSELTWLWKWLHARKLDSYVANRGHLHRLAFYSRTRLHLVTAELKLDYERSDGCVVLLRRERDSHGVQPRLQVMRQAGVNFKEIGPDEARKIEPALNPDMSFFGAIHLPDDEVGNCLQFALLLKTEAQRLGVKFHFNTQVLRLNVSRGMALTLVGDPKPHAYDAAVVCAGVDSAALLMPLGLKIPLAAVHGYSVSATLREPLNAPRSAVMDERYKVAISRMGNRVRVAGSAEIGGSPHLKRASSLQTLYKVLHDWFPGAANLAGGAQEWKGARSMLPDGPPILGASGVPGLRLNLGHGSSGWALSCGSARVIADLIHGKAPDLDISGLEIEHLQI